jgi:hypothetical protein
MRGEGPLDPEGLLGRTLRLGDGGDDDETLGSEQGT